MNEKIENVKTEICDFANKAKNEATRAANDAVEWAIDNKELVIAMIPVAIAAIKTGQSLAVNHRVKMERKRIDHTYYDPSTGMHWDLKRVATNNDRVVIMKRRKNGDEIYDILRDMKLI